MIDYLKVQNFLVENNLTWEELGILYTIYAKTQNREYAILAKTYYTKEYQASYNKKNVPQQWGDMIENLIHRGFLEDYRKQEERDSKAIPLSKLVVTDKFLQILIIDKDSAYEQALGCYPDYLHINGHPVLAKTNTNNQQLKDLFYKDILKGGNKQLLDRFIYITLEIHEAFMDYSRSEDKVVYTFNKPATRGWKSYLESFEVIANEFEKGNVHSNINRLI